ncbi:MAG: TlpA family protein disulfide reductase [Prolixibacteraceae bacterium]
MKKLNLVLTACLLVFFANATTLKVKLTTANKTPKANFGLGYVQYTLNQELWSKCDTMLISANGEFEIELNDGIYTLFLNHPYCDEFYYHVQATGQNEINLEVALTPLSIQQAVKKVTINGEFNNYNNNTILEYDEKAKVYRLPKDAMDLKIDKFYFKLNDKQQLHSTRLPMTEIDVWHCISNVNSKGNKRIVFDPSEYGFVDTTGQPNNIILNPREYHNWMIKPDVKANKEVVDFNEVCFTQQEIVKNLSTAMYELRTLINYETYKDIYKSNIQRYNDLKGLYPLYSSMYLLPDYEIASRFDTVYVEYYNYAIKKQSTDADKVRKSEPYINYMKNKALALKSLLQNSAEIPTSVLRQISPYYDTELYNYGILDEIGLPFGYFNNYIIEMEQGHVSDEVGGTILFNQARNTERYSPVKAKAIVEEIMTKYPSYSGLQNEEISNFMNKFNVTEGSPAPDFDLLSLDNKKIKLSDYKGKYVFIDFWGTWCGPCTAEIPNVKKLDESFNDDQLVVIGISTNDTEEKLRAFIEENEMKYANVMSNKTVNIEYGVNSYPTTFLIDKEGHIMAKNLRGNRLSEIITSLIND